MDARVKEIYFTKVSDIREHYTLLDDVFPNADGRISTTKRVCFAKNKRKETFVIKQRHKQNSFKDDNEVKDWLFCTKLLYMLTANPKNDRNTNGRYMQTTHIARVVEIIEDSKYYYCVMEYVKGRDLFEYFIQEKPHNKGHQYAMSISRGLAVEMVVGLAHMHQLGLAHRDIKLENLVLDEA